MPNKMHGLGLERGNEARQSRGILLEVNSNGRIRKHSHDETLPTQSARQHRHDKS